MVAQYPMVAKREVGGSILPVAVSISMGTSTAMVLTAYPDTVSLAALAAAASSAAVRTPGTPLPRVRKFAVSKVAPRSIQNASSVVPAKTLIPFVRL